jgi:glycerol uptake facilitator-like aquaporin
MNRMLAEAVGTFCLVFFGCGAILADASAHPGIGPLGVALAFGVAVGGMVAVSALVGGPLTGASMNPACSLGPALVGGDCAALWIYLSAPVLGALLASPTCRWVQGDACCIVRNEMEEEPHD